jgi:signal peptidase I
MEMKPGTLRARIRKLCKEEILPLVILALVLFSIRSSLADWNDVPTGSMKPTILEGDRVYVNKLAYDLKVPFTTWHLAQWDNPKRGEIVVFYSPHDGKRLVKRVVGLPGDTIELRRDTLLLNGKAVEYGPIPAEVLRDVSAGDKAMQLYAEEHLPGQPHAVAAIPTVTALRDFGPAQVERDHYFMMGDNRDNSFDSRYYGTVPRKAILGRATTVVISVDKEHYWIPRWKRSFSKLD